MKLNQRGFIPIVLTAIVALAIGASAAYVVVTQSKFTNQEVQSTNPKERSVVNDEKVASTSEEIIVATTSSKSVVDKTEARSNTEDTQGVVGTVHSTLSNTESLLEKSQLPRNSIGGQETVQPITQTESQGFETKCHINDDEDSVVERNHTFELNIDIIDTHTWSRVESKYDFNWGKKYLIKADKDTAEFLIGDLGNFDLYADVTRRSDGFTTRISCSVTVPCDSYGCLSDAGKKQYDIEARLAKLRDIDNRIDSWYDGEYENLGPVDRCLISESIIRSLEYDYTLLGGQSIPGFSKDEDCATVVAPKAYQSNIQSLIHILEGQL